MASRSARSKPSPEYELLEALARQPHRLGWILGYDKLGPLHSEWIRYMFCAGGDRVLQAHRNSYKTTCIVVGLIWSGLFSPNRTHLLLRKTASDADATLQEVARHYERPELRRLYSAALGVQEPKGRKWLKNSMRLSTKETITKEETFEYAGIADSVTGRHYDVIVADDIVTLRDRLSKAERETVKAYYRELANIKKADGGFVAVSGTPWARDDAFSIMPAPLRYPYSETGILAESKIAELRRTMTPSLFAANYELKHIADGDKLFGNPVLEPWPNGQAIAYVDPAYGGGNNTAMAIGIKPRRETGKAAVRGYTWTDNIVNRYKEIVALCERWNVGTLYVEANKDEGAAARDIARLRTPVAPTKVFKNKHIRIITHVYENWERIAFADDCDSSFIANILDYEEGEPDDEVDALAGLLEKMALGRRRHTFSEGAASTMAAGF